MTAELILGDCRVAKAWFARSEPMPKFPKEEQITAPFEAVQVSLFPDTRSQAYAGMIGGGR